MFKKIRSILCTLLCMAVLLSLGCFTSVCYAEDKPADFVVTKYFGGNAVEGTDYTYEWDSEGRGCLKLLTDNLTVSMADGVSVTDHYIVSGLPSGTSFCYGVHLDGVTINTANSYALSLSKGVVLFIESDSTLIGKEYGIIDSRNNFDIFNKCDISRWTSGSNNSSIIAQLDDPVRTKLTVSGGIDGINCSTLGVNGYSMVLTNGGTGYGINTMNQVWHNNSTNLVLTAWGARGAFQNIQSVSTSYYSIKANTEMDAATATQLTGSSYSSFSDYKYVELCGNDAPATYFVNINGKSVALAYSGDTVEVVASEFANDTSLEWEYELVNSTATELTVTTVGNTAKFTMPEFNDNGENGGVKFTVTEMPTLSVSISVGENEFLTVANEVTFDEFTKSDVTALITTDLEANKLDSLSYYISDKALSAEQLAAVTGWTSVPADGKVTVSGDGKYVIYARVVNTDSEAAYSSTNGFVVDKTAPSIEGIEDSAKFCTDTEITIADANPDSVSVNGEPVTLTDGKYTLTADKDYTITAKDKAGNSADISVKFAHTYNAEVWSSDETYHWHECSSCGAYLDKEKHISGGAATPDKAEICTKCNYEIAPATGYVAAPVIEPAAKTFSNSVKVTITCATEGAAIYYTTDGTAPTTESTLYNGEIVLTATTTVNAIAVKDGMGDSTVATATFTKSSSGGGSSGGGGGTGGSGNTTPSEPGKPSIGGANKSWSDVAADLAKLTAGSGATIRLNGNTTVPEDVIKAIADSDLKVTFVINSIFSWIVDGSEIKTPAAADLSILTTSQLKTDALRGIKGVQFTINNTNLPTDLEIAFRPAHAGKSANLYKEVSGELVFVTCAKLGEDGKVILPDVTEKGNYVVMLCEYSDISGDVDNDGKLTNADAEATLKDIVGLEQGENLLVADFNGDGMVTPADAAAILKRIAGLA